MKMKNRMVDKSRNTPYDEAYKALRTNLEFLHTAQDLRVILLVAPEEQSGKCAFVQNLAVVLASKERQVLLMDCDLRCGALTKHLSTAAGVGVSELLAAEQKPVKKCSGLRRMWTSCPAVLQRQTLLSCSSPVRQWTVWQSCARNMITSFWMHLRSRQLPKQST